MSEYKPITGELRDWFEHAYSYDVGETPWFGWKSTIEQMLDAIDSIHAALEAECERLRDSDGWIELPKDADGEYIHEYDKVDWRDHAGTWHENATVVALCNDGCYVMYALDGMVIHVNKSDIRHHRVQTVEDVLREMLDAWGELPSNETNDAIVAEYAKRLTLAGDAE